LAKKHRDKWELHHTLCSIASKYFEAACFRADFMLSQSDGKRRWNDDLFVIVYSLFTFTTELHYLLELAGEGFKELILATHKIL